MSMPQLKRESRSPQPRSSKLVSVTAVIPVRNEELFLGETLDQLLDQDLTNVDLEILVVDGRSTDRTREIAQTYAARHPRIRVLDNENRLSSAARNVAIRQSTADYFIVIDGHCQIPTRNYFQNLVRAFEKSGADCLGRPQPLDVTHATPLQKAIALARASRLGHHPESHIYDETAHYVPAKSVAVAYRREVFEQVGLFDESFDAHEDGELNYRCDQAGLRCYLEPQITVKYVPRSSLWGLFRQMMRYGRGRVRFSRKHPGTWGWGTLVPAMLLAFMLVGGLLSLAVPHAVWFYLCGLGIYAAAVLAASVRVAWRNGQPGLAWRMPGVFLAVHLGAGTGVWLELLRWRR